MFGYCLHQLRSRAEAEDATQTTFLYALRALRRGVVPECESAWLTTIAKNVCHSERRTVDRRGPLAPEVDLDTIALAQTGEDEEELLLGFREALASMPERQRRALVLREWQGVPSREIASELGLSATATHALLTRARHSFAQALTLPGRPVAGLAWLAFELRSHLKALLGGVSTKAAVTSVAVIAVGVGAGGVVVERSLADSTGSIGSGARHRPVGDRVERGRAAHAARHIPFGRRVARAGRLESILPRCAVHPSGPGDEHRHADERRRLRNDRRRRLPRRRADGARPDPEPTKPAVDLPVVLPIDPPQLPVVELPPLPSPPVAVPPLPAAELPPVPPLPLPSEAPPVPAVPLP